MNFGRFEFPKSVTGRSVLEEGHTLPPVKRIDCRCEACRFAGESRQNDMAARMRHHVGERRTGVAGRAASLENGVLARRHETVDPPCERNRRIERRRCSAATHERHRNSRTARVRQRAPAIAECPIGAVERRCARARQMLPLHVDQHQHRETCRAGERPQRNDVVHSTLSRAESTDGRVAARALDCSSTPGRCHRPSGRMTT